jgi:hypothetical protein
MGNGTSSFFGSDWLGAFLIIAVLFGGFGGFGFGGRGPENYATPEYVQSVVNNQSTQTGLRDILLSSANNNYETAQLINAQTNALQQQNYANQINVVQGFNAIQQAIAQLGYQMDSCCCSIKTQMLQDKYEALENQYRTAQNDLSNAAQSQYILNALGRFVAYPPAAATIATQG